MFPLYRTAIKCSQVCRGHQLHRMAGMTGRDNFNCSELLQAFADVRQQPYGASHGRMGIENQQKFHVVCAAGLNDLT